MKLTAWKNDDSRAHLFKHIAVGSVLSRPAIAPFLSKAWKHESADFMPWHLVQGTTQSDHKVEIHSTGSVTQIAMCRNSAEPRLKLQLWLIGVEVSHYNIC